MNNYCTNCGEKLEDNVIKCDKCNTYVIDLKTIKRKKARCIIGIIIIFLVLGIISVFACYNVYCKVLNKTIIYKKYLKDDFKDAQYVGYDSCHAQGAFWTYTVAFCHLYYYKSNPSVESPDIVVYSYKDDISIDYFSVIINKYGFDEPYEEFGYEYHTKKRRQLEIEFNDINDETIIKMYDMVNEIIDIYRKNNENDFNIRINSYRPDHFIEVAKENRSTESIITWTFDHNLRIANPSLNEVKKYITNPEKNK